MKYAHLFAPSKGSRLCAVLFVPSEKIKTDEQPDNAEKIEFHLKTDLEFTGAQVQIEGVRKSNPKGNEIVRKEGFNDVVTAGNKGDECA
jgi:hypothetical protein